jgi:outer membrane protein assembly factor BamD
VQEVIADGEFKVARFYYLRPDYRASAARLVELTERYPLYSGSDEALWMLGDIYAVMKNKGSRNEDDKNHWADLEGKVLDRIVSDYPVSPRATQAKTQLKAMGMTVPAANPTAVAQMQKQEAFIKAHRQSMMKEPLALMKSGPDLSMAAQSGMPNLTPPADSITAKDILSPTTAGPKFNLAADAGTGGGGTDVSGTGASITSVNDAAPSPAASNDPNANAIVSAPTTASGNASSPASSDPVGQVDAPTTSSSDTAPAPAAAASGAPAQGGAPSASQGGAATAPATPGTESSSKNESSSKKKKGLGKLNPF